MQHVIGNEWQKCICGPIHGNLVCDRIVKNSLSVMSWILLRHGVRSTGAGWTRKRISTCQSSEFRFGWHNKHNNINRTSIDSLPTINMASLLSCWPLLILILASKTVPSTSSSLVVPAPPADQDTSNSNYYDHVSREYAQAFPDSTFLDNYYNDDDQQQQVAWTSLIFPCLPQHLHLAQASDVADGENDQHHVVSMTVSFSLNYAHCRYGRPIVQFGRGNNDSFWHRKPEGQVRGDHPLQFNYTSDETNHNSNNNNNQDSTNDGGVYQSDWIYHVVLPNLQAGQQTYWYRIIVVEEPMTASATTSTTEQQQQPRSLRGSTGYFLGETRPLPFRTPPCPGTPTTLALVGDLGQTRNSTRTVWAVYQSSISRSSSTLGDDNDDDDDEAPVSHLLIAGDMAYADSDPTRWTSWLQLVEPLARSLPMHVLPGNHEIEVRVQLTLRCMYVVTLDRPNRHARSHINAPLFVSTSATPPPATFSFHTSTGFEIPIAWVRPARNP